MIDHLSIPEHIVSAIRAHARAEAPNEACGYLAAKKGIVSTRIAMTNVDNSPEHFSFDPAEQFQAVRTAREAGDELIAVYHSHPETPPRMSGEDIRLANDPAMIYVIHSLKQAETKAFRVSRGKAVSDVAVTILKENS